MKNKHLEHPEDSILEGKDGLYKILNFFKGKNSKLSVKYDGAPAIVWGINPENDKFFVGTKSVFNKVKIKINYTHYDIETNHGHTPGVASILHMCLEKLPRDSGVYQGDFIGFGGGKEYTPNTITYKFNEDVEEDIIVAAHTVYIGDTIKDSVASFDCGKIASEECKFLKTYASFWGRDYRVGLYISLARVLSNYVTYPSKELGQQLKQYINNYVRMGVEIDAKKIAKETGCSVNLIHLYNLVIEIKRLLMNGILIEEDVKCFLGENKSTHEGYVMTNKYGTYKLINREEFSHANFTMEKKWDK